MIKLKSKETFYYGKRKETRYAHPQIEDWQNRPFSEGYPILYMDAIHHFIRDNGVICKLAAYIILGINQDGRKEVLTIEGGENESPKCGISACS